MPSRVRFPSRRASCLRYRHLLPLQTCRYASSAAATITPAPSRQQATSSIPPISRHPPTQPPSHKPPEFRKSQLHRQYTSLLRSTPLMLLFQHNNLKSTEWVGVRRELTQALRKVDQARAAEGREHTELADGIKLQTLQTGIFAAALRVVEFYRPESSATLLSTTASSEAPALTHALSRAAHDAVVNKKLSHALAPLLSGPLVVLSFPTVSPSHLAAALSILAPSPPQFAAPKRRVSPGYYDPAVQGGLQKLLLLGARVEGKVFDSEGTRWVGSIEGGLDGLRAQLVWMLQGVGSGLTNTLESAGQSLYLTMEGRKEMLEDGEKGPGETDGIDKEA